MDEMLMPTRKIEILGKKCHFTYRSLKTAELSGPMGENVRSSLAVGLTSLNNAMTASFLLQMNEKTMK